MEIQEQTSKPHKQRKMRSLYEPTLFKDVVIMIISCFLVAVSYYTFVTPNHFAPGGIYGLGNMIQNKTQGVFGLEHGIPWAIPVLIFSIPLIIISLKVLDRRAALVVTAMVVITNVIDILLELMNFPQFIAQTEFQKCFSSAIGGMINGVVFAFGLKYFGTADGTIAISAIIKAKKPHANVPWITFALDAIVVASSLFVYWTDYTDGISGFNYKIVKAFEPIVYSLINLFFVSKCCDVILKGFDMAYKFEVVTDKPEELSRVLIEKLGRGVTSINVKGMYSGTDKNLIFCIVPKKQIGDFKKILKDFPGSFACITSTNEVIGSYSR